MMITFQAFKTDVFRLVFPDLMAEQRVPLFRNFIVNALIHLQTFVESYQLTNVNFYDKDQSWDDCNLSIVQGCRGQIGGVYSFKPSCRCQRYFYEPASLEKISCLYEKCRCQPMCLPTPAYMNNPLYCGDYVGGNQGCTPPYLAHEPEDDCQFILSEKFFAIGPNQKIWLFPRFPCGHILATHWRGTRRTYLDNDYVLDDEDLKDAVACYVESEIARRVDKDQATADKLYAEFRLKTGDIIFREERDLRPRATRVCVEGLDLSELVQIYPSNLYPTEVGYACADAADGLMSPAVYSCPPATGEPTDLGGGGALPDTPPTLPARLRIKNWEAFKALLNGTCSDCLDENGIASPVEWDGTFPYLDRDDNVPEYRYQSWPPLEGSFGNLVLDGKRLGICIVRYAYNNLPTDNGNGWVVEILCLKVAPPAFIEQELVWSGMLALGQDGIGTYTLITEDIGSSLPCASAPSCCVIESY